MGEKRMPRKEFRNMATKYAREETLPARNLRTISQKELVDLVYNHEKLGLIVNDELKITMIRPELLDEMVEHIRTLEDTIEDLLLSIHLEKRTLLPESEWEEKPEDRSFFDWYLEGKAGKRTAE